MLQDLYTRAKGAQTKLCKMEINTMRSNKASVTMEKGTENKGVHVTRRSLEIGIKDKTNKRK